MSDLIRERPIVYGGSGGKLFAIVVHGSPGEAEVREVIPLSLSHVDATSEPPVEVWYVRARDEDAGTMQTATIRLPLPMLGQMTVGKVEDIPKKGGDDG